MNTSAVCRFNDVINVPIRPMPVRISRPHGLCSTGPPIGTRQFDSGPDLVIPSAVLGTRRVPGYVDRHYLVLRADRRIRLTPGRDQEVTTTPESIRT